MALLESDQRQLRWLEARKLLELSCVLDSAVGCRLFADQLLGDPGAAPWATALRHYHRACRLGDTRACHRVAILQRHGHGRSRDEAGALASSQQACNRGVGRACGDVQLSRAPARSLAGTEQEVMAGLAHVRPVPEAEVRAYGTTLAISYLVGPLLTPATVGAALLGPAIVHVTHGQAGRAPGAMLGTVGGPFVGGLLFALLASAADPWNTEEWAVLGAVSGYAGWAIYDVSYRSGVVAVGSGRSVQLPELRAGVFGWRP